MTRLLPLALLLTLTVHAAVPIAPLPEGAGPLWHTDTDAKSASDGNSTLVVWDNFQNPYLEGYSIYARLLDSEHEGNAFRIGQGHGPRVATNGTDYLIAYAITVSRFSSPFRPTVMAHVVHADGTLGDAVYLHHSTQVYPSMSAIAWSGSKWLVAFRDPTPMIALVSADLHDVRILELSGSSPIRQLVTVGGKTFAVRTVEDRTEAIEIRDDAAIGATHTTSGADGMIVATSATAATALFGLEAATFTATNGFGTRSVILSGPSFLDAIASDSGTLVLHYDAAAKTLGVTEVAGTTARNTTTVLRDIGPYHHARLGATRNGPVLFYSFTTDFSVQFNDDLYAYSLAPPRAYALDEGALVSVIDRSRQSAPSLMSNGTNLIAFWTQTDDADGFSWFSRPLDSNGMPAGEITQLPAEAFVSDVFTFDGTRFTMIDAAGVVTAITISADGKTAGRRIALGHGYEAAVASNAKGTFAIWIDETNQVRGTPLREDATPHVPNGFPILPTLFGQQRNAAIAAAGDDFVLLWSDDQGVQSVTISAAGTVSSSSRLGNQPESWDQIVLTSRGNSALAAWKPVNGPSLFALGGPAQPFELFDPHFGAWYPRKILPLADDRYLIVFQRDGILWTSEITMSGAFITGIGEPRVLGRFPESASRLSFATIGSTPVVGFSDGPRGLIATSPRPRPRAVRR